MPEPAEAELPLTVQSVRVAVPKLNTPPPPYSAELPLTVQSVRLAVPKLYRPPPAPSELPLKVQSVRSAVPSFARPPPPIAPAGVAADGAVGQGQVGRRAALNTPPPSAEPSMRRSGVAAEGAVGERRRAVVRQTAATDRVRDRAVGDGQAGDRGGHTGVDLKDAAVPAAADGHPRGRPGDRLRPAGVFQLELAAGERDRLGRAEDGRIEDDLVRPVIGVGLVDAVPQVARVAGTDPRIPQAVDGEGGECAGLTVSVLVVLAEAKVPSLV